VSTFGGRVIMPGAEPFEYPGRTDVGVLLSHGFTGSPYELRPVAKALAAHGIGSVGILLRGHGTHPDDMLGCTYIDWLRDLEDGLTRLLSRYERAVIVGLSMGGTLALNVASRWANDDRLAGLVTVGAPIYLSDWRLKAVRLISKVVKWTAWGQPDIKDRTVWDRQVSYRRFRTSAIPELLDLMRETKQRLPEVRQPILVVHANDDHVVPPGNADAIFNAVGSRDRQVMLLDNCYHVVTVDFDADLLKAAIRSFVERVGSSTGVVPNAVGGLPGEGSGRP
jgi:carboxylesterase